MEPSTQIGSVDIQEKIYQRLQKLKEMYSTDIEELYTKLQSKSELPMPPDRAEKLQQFKKALQRFMQYFDLQKSSIPAGTKEEKIDSLEKQVVTILNISKLKNPTPQQQGQQQLPRQAGGQVQSVQPNVVKNKEKEKKPRAHKGPKLTPSHPTYLQMITEAITSLKERSGSSYYAISHFVDAKYKTQLPANYKKLLTGQLRKLAKSGKLTKVKGSFKVPYELNKAPKKATSTKPKVATKRLASKSKAVVKAPAEGVKASKVPKEKKVPVVVVKASKIPKEKKVPVVVVKKADKPPVNKAKVAAPKK